MNDPLYVCSLRSIVVVERRWVAVEKEEQKIKETEKNEW